MRKLPEPIRSIVDWFLPVAARRWVVRRFRRPPVGGIDFGELRRAQPFSREFGYDRGTPVDRHYIERFLEAHASSIRGAVLEIGTNEYTVRFGGSRVARSDVLHAADDAPGVTIVADLTRGESIPDDRFDCILMTQTLQFIGDYRAALATVHRILKPGGAALMTFPGIAPISGEDMRRWGEHWRFTRRSARDLFQAAFPGGRVEVQAYGNVFSTTAFLYGVAREELTDEELDSRDDDIELLLGVLAIKSDGAA